jgi:uncharacterized protein
MVAFSGGVDSTFLLATAKQVLNDKVVAVTGKSIIHPQNEADFAAMTAKKIGVRHIIRPTDEMNLPEFVKNGKDRCYVCKKNLLKDLKKMAYDMGISTIADGSNKDDLNDFRPGLDAARESGVISPLIEAGLAKEDIRLLSKEMGLETWDKPAMPCLATRLPYGTPITEKALKMIEKAENVLINLGIRYCRVRHYNDMAKIEMDPKDFMIIFKDNTRNTLIEKFKKIGYRQVTVDLEGYKQGSMNR